MTWKERALRAVYRVAARGVSGSGDYADLMYEKVQRPSHLLILAGNYLNYRRRRPRISGIVSLSVEVVFGCNLGCEYCWGAMRDRLEGRRPTLMTWDLFARVVDSAPASLESMVLAGLGEPLAHPELCRMIEYTAGHGIRPIVFTNATLLTGDRLKRLAATPLSVLNISVEPDAETSLRVRGVELEVIKDHVAQFVAAKSPKTEVKLSVVAHPGNVDQLEGLWHEWAGLATAAKVTPRFSFEGDRPGVLCMEPWRGSMTVLSNGDVTPCCFDMFTEDLIIGNVARDRLADLVHSQALEDMLRSMIEGRTPPACRTCTQFAARGVPVRTPRQDL